MIKSITTDAQKVKLLREAAAVRRCHTATVIGEYNIGIHTFNMLVMLRFLWPDAPRDLIWAVLEHDLPERLSGDIPSPAKAYGIVDRNLLGDFEFQFLSWIFGRVSHAGLGEVENGWIKGLDLLELIMWTKDQVTMGNMNSMVMANKARAYMARDTTIPLPIRELLIQLDRMDWIFQEDL